MKNAVVVGNGSVEHNIKQALRQAFPGVCILGIADGDGVKTVGELGEIDVIIIDPENGLAEADEIAGRLQMATDNLPYVIVIRQDSCSCERGDRRGYANIDLIVPDFDAENLRQMVDRLPWKGLAE